MEVRPKYGATRLRDPQNAGPGQQRVVQLMSQCEMMCDSERLRRSQELRPLPFCSAVGQLLGPLDAGSVPGTWTRKLHHSSPLHSGIQLLTRHQGHPRARRNLCTDAVDRMLS